MSRPPRARGLKPVVANVSASVTGSRPPRARGLTRNLIKGEPCKLKVAPPAGAWIETDIASAVWTAVTRSRPPRARGLKHHHFDAIVPGPTVAPPAGAWIETCPRTVQLREIPGRAPRGRVD